MPYRCMCVCGCADVRLCVCVRGCAGVCMYVCVRACVRTCARREIFKKKKVKGVWVFPKSPPFPSQKKKWYMWKGKGRKKGKNG